MEQESLRRLLTAVTLLSGAHLQLRRSRRDVRAFLRDPGWGVTPKSDAVCAYIVYPTEPVLAQLAGEPDVAAYRGRLRVLGFQTGELPPTPAMVSVARTCVSEYPGEVEVTEDFAERFHAPLFVKLFLFVIIFDLDLQYITLLMVAFILHVHGVFEPVLRFFTHGPRRRPDPLDRVLQNLEQRQQQPPEVAAEETTTSPTMRALYQSVGMFLGTLLPWWTPDQRYLR